MQPFINIDLGGPAQPLLKVNNLLKHFPAGGSKAREVVQAVDDVSFSVIKGETLGVVGESGCGKSTTARLLMQLLKQDSGELIFDGLEVGSSRLPMKAYRRQVQMVFQDSYASLNPRMTMEESIAFGQRVHGVSAKEASEYARYLLAHVGLEPERFAHRYPHALSGGQRQRVNIARALAMKPRLVILDEAVSALDKSVEAQVLQLLQELKRTLALTYVFISHDLHVVRWLSDRILVMYLGEVVEIGPAEQLFTASAHPYTRALSYPLPARQSGVRRGETDARKRRRGAPERLPDGAARVALASKYRHSGGQPCRMKPTSISATCGLSFAATVRRSTRSTASPLMCKKAR